MNSYPVELNHIAFITYSDEPVFVIRFIKNDEGQDAAIVRRAVTVDGATRYEQDVFLLAELESEKAHVIAHLEATKFQAEQRDKYSKEYHASQKAAQAMHTPMPDGTGYPN